jgi:hypothetical protein
MSFGDGNSPSVAPATCCGMLSLTEIRECARLRIFCGLDRCARRWLVEQRADTVLRCVQLRLHADVIQEYMDGWLSAQLRDLADLLEWRDERLT